MRWFLLPTAPSPRQPDPGVTLSGLNEICKQVLAEGCMKLGLIDSAEKIGTYYMHGVSHHLGIDVHDVSAGRDEPLKPGARDHR